MFVQVVRVCMHGATENMPFLVQQPLVALFCPILDEVMVLPFLAPDQLAHLLQDSMNGDTAPPTGPPKGIGREFPQWSQLWRLSPKKRADCAGRCWQIVLAYAGLCWHVLAHQLPPFPGHARHPWGPTKFGTPHDSARHDFDSTPDDPTPSRCPLSGRSTRGPHQKVRFF